MKKIKNYMRIYLIDIDGTICDDIKNEESYLYPDAKPIDGSKEIINDWFNNGETIFFFTAREEKDRKVTEQWLNKWGFLYHGLIMGKPRCKSESDEYIWIDNRKVRGITYRNIWGDLKEVQKTILTFGD